jgi:hypothetical protein
MVTTVPVRLKQVSIKAIEYVNSKKIHPRESFYAALDRLLEIKGVD